MNSKFSTSGRDPLHRRAAQSIVTFAGSCLLGCVAAVGFTVVVAQQPAAAQASTNESRLLSGIRQLTYDGARAGEGYFNRDGSMLVFQSEREPGNPFYQIYLMDLETGDVDRVSPGFGKTTCAWIHPDASRVLFASTHGDAASLEKQQAELDFRASGQTRRYSWDYDEHFDLYAAAPNGEILQQLTDARGYDAEASYSPDGQWIAFASNRRAYSEPMSAEDAELFEVDPSYMMDIYIMRSDGSEVRQLTDVPGYDGGPFFSPDGSRITWRRFAPNGLTAEVYTMNLDGSDQRRLTHLNAMSWAPYYHPSGDYLIFATNRHGFENFELYLVDAAGEREPVRVTETAGFDGLPVFAPDGERLAWTSNRTPGGESQIFMAGWNDALARELLFGAGGTPSGDAPAVVPDLSSTAPAIRAEDMRQHIEVLAGPAMEGRRSGTPGERRATDYIAAVLEATGLEPAGDNGTWFQPFEFTAGVDMGAGNRLRMQTEGGSIDFEPGTAWRPLAFSKTGEIGPAGVVFAGYGIRAPGDNDIDEYDSFVHLDVTDKWVMVFRYMPENISDEMRQHFNTHSSLRYKAMTLRDLGARGMIVVSGPNSGVRNELVALEFDTAIGATSIAAVSITDAAARQILAASGRDLGELQTALDGGELMQGFEIAEAIVGGTIVIETETRTGRNVLARLPGADATAPRLVVGAHADHLGIGRGGSSLARDDESGGIHYGADDNASGVAGVLEIAQYLKDLTDAGRITLSRDVVFALWSAEELGLLGAEHFVRTIAADEDAESIRDAVAAYLNMDMIGRLDDDVLIQGVGSSSAWAAEIERRNVPVGLPIVVQQDPYLPTDVRAFYMKGVPVLNAFTGSHQDYHTPRDTADKINYEGAADIARFMGLLARSLATGTDVPDYLAYARPENLAVRANMRAYLGTIPDYIEPEIPGVALSGATPGGPAAEAGLQQGDIIVELAGRTIENIYDYTYAIEALGIGEPTSVVVIRDGERIELQITPLSRQ